MLFSTSFAVAATALLGFAQAQNSSTASASTTVAAGRVAPTQAAYWCTSQRNTCRQVCGGSAPTDNCDATTFVYSCICGDGSMPDLSQYNNSLPFFECQAAQSQCVMNTDDATAQLACRNKPCGGKDPVAAESVYSASVASAQNTASSTSASHSSSTGSSSSSSTSSKSSAANTHRSGMEVGATVAFIATGLVFFGAVLTL